MKNLWNLLCSLKLAIVLASAATLVMVGGSVLMPARPEVFGNMDALALGEWWRAAGARSAGATWWVPAGGILLSLLGVNTACCFVDWVLRIRSRWRKTGEYLLHLGFVLALAGYLWGALAGARGTPVPLVPGQLAPLPALPGYYLRLDSLDPGDAGRDPRSDWRSTLTLLRGEGVVTREEVSTNRPLLHGGVVAVPLRLLRPGGRFAPPAGLFAVYRDPGAPLALVGGGLMLLGSFLALFSFYIKRSRGDRPDVV